MLATMDHCGRRAAHSGMAAVLVVVDLEVPQQLGQVVQPADHGEAVQPLLLQRQDGPLGDRDRAVLADGTESHHL